MLGLGNLSSEELRDQARAADERVKALAVERARRVREQISALLASNALTIEQVFGTMVSEKMTHASKAKFRNPEHPGQTWSGRGKRPAWFEQALAAGKTKADLLVTTKAA